MQDVPETPRERLQRRRIRRWKRRARVAGPFLGIPLLLLTLSLSVGVIEYRPHKKADRLANRPIRMPTTAGANSIWPDRLPASDANSVVPNAPDTAGNAKNADMELTKNGFSAPEVMPALPTVPRPPTRPTALGRR